VAVPKGGRFWETELSGIRLAGCLRDSRSMEVKMNEEKRSIDILNKYPQADEALVNSLLEEECKKSSRKIIVLDDDPTGVQTVHDVSVYTDWSPESIRAGFAEENALFFLLTNSRSFTAKQTAKAHREIAERVADTAREAGRDYLILSRGDSTLRGHYPLETELLGQVYRERWGKEADGEILCPYFREGGRFTIDNVHYVRYGEELVPAGKTEFAGDETFGYTSSNLCEYVEEKTKGACRKEDCLCIGLELLRGMEFDRIVELLCGVRHYRRIIVNAVSDCDVKIFAIALYRALAKGKYFTVRCAAALVKAIGNISDRPLLRGAEMVSGGNDAGGVIVVGSHTRKTTLQLERLKELKNIEFIEMNSDLVLVPGALEQETEQILKREEELIRAGKNVCVSTKRTLLKVENDTPEEALMRSVRISEALQRCVGGLKARPAFVVAKGGITSSDVGVKALRVKRATVLGQIQPGIPVWQTGAESLFPGIPYIIFPGNVGEEDTLKKAVQILVDT